MKSILGILATELNKIGVPYEYMRWTSSVQYPYWIGEVTEVATDSEDGYKEYTAIVTGTADGSWLELENDRKKIEDHFPSVYGFRASTDKETMVIFYENSFPVPTGESDLKRMQINLRIKHWKGMN